MSIETARSHLAELGQRAGIDLELDPAGSCAIDFGENGKHTLLFQFAPQRQTLVVLSPVAPVSQGSGEYFLRLVLRLNFQCLTRFGGTLGLDEEGGLVIFAGAFPLEGSSYEGFEAFLEPFVAAIEELKDLFASEDLSEAGDRFVTDEDVALYGIRV